MSAESELPLRVVETRHGPVLRCLCSAEAAAFDPGPARLGRPGHAAVTVRDLSPAALARMVIHAKTCLAGKNIALALARPSTSSPMKGLS